MNCPGDSDYINYLESIKADHDKTLLTMTNQIQLLMTNLEEWQ